MPKDICAAPLTIVVPLTAKGYVEGIVCTRPENHKSRLHEATHRGGVNGNPATVSIKWSENAAK